MAGSLRWQKERKEGKERKRAGKAKDTQSREWRAARHHRGKSPRIGFGWETALLPCVVTHALAWVRMHAWAWKAFSLSSVWA